MTNKELPWASFKAFVSARGLSIQYIDIDSTYFMWAIDGLIAFECAIYKDAGSDQTDFETNFKSKGNQSPVMATGSYGAKTFGSKKLYGRNTGFQQALTVGSNIINYTATYAWAKVVGVEVIGGETLDYCEFEIYDNSSGTYSGTPNAKLNQFAFTFNIAKDYYKRESRFDADLYVGMIIKVTYNSVSAKTVGINILQDEVK